MKWTVFFVVMLIILLPQPLLLSYTQSLDDRSVKLVESTNYGSASVNGYLNVNVAEAKEMIESNPDLVILDVRTLAEYESGHIEDAVLIPVTELEDRINELDKEKETLVHCKSGGRSATASQILVDNAFVSVYNMLGGITAWKNAGYWIEIIHEGDLIIDGTQTLVIENCIYVVIGSIYIQDQGKLIARNVELIIDQSHTLPNYFFVEDSGELRTENTTIQFGVAVDIHNEAQVYFINSSVGALNCFQDSRVYIYNSTMFSILNRGQSRVVVSDSEIDGFILTFPLSSQVANLEGLRPGFYKYWNLHENQSVSNVFHDLTVENTFVNSWSVLIEQDPTVTISNSEIDTIAWGFHDTNVSIDGVRLGLYGNWTIGKLTLLNTSITSWLLRFENCLAEISNATAQIALEVYINVSIRDSILMWLKAWDLLNGVVQFQETSIDMFVTYFSNFYIHGEINFLPEAYVSDWTFSNITRNYPITVMNKTGNPVSDTELSLYDENDTVVWNGFTDSLGKANFNLTFTDKNHTDILKLEAVKGDYSAKMNVTFLSDTPVVLAMRYFADLNGDGTVNIMDIAIVAKAYGSKYNETDGLYWHDPPCKYCPHDPLCDINRDDVIDILDIAMVAKAYGKNA